MSELDRDMIAADDGIARQFGNARSPGELEQMERITDVVDRMATLARGVEWSALAELVDPATAVVYPVIDPLAFEGCFNKGHNVRRSENDARMWWWCYKCGDYIAKGDIEPVAQKERRARAPVQFADYQAMARTLNGGALTFESWGKLAIVNPVVAAALDAAEREEAVGKVSGVFRCNACLDAGDLGARFDWGGALFIHLLTCSRFTATVAP